MSRVVAFVVTALVAAACGGAAPAPAAQTATSAASPTPQPVKLTISYSNVITDYLPLWVAHEGGYLAKNGIDAELVSIASAQGVAALVSGQVQVAVIGGSEIMSAAAGGADLAIVAAMVGVYPFIFEVSSAIKTVADLKGKKVGVSSFGSSSDIATRVTLRRLGLDPDKDVIILPVGSVEARTAAMLGGNLDAGVSLVPDTIVLEDRGFHPLYNLAEQKLPSSQTMVAVQRSMITSRRDVVQRLVDSLVQAIAREKKDRAFSIQVLTKYLKSNDQRALGIAYDFYANNVHVSLPAPRPEQFADAKATLGEKNEKVKNFDLSKLLDDSFVKSAADRGLDKAP